MSEEEREKWVNTSMKTDSNPFLVQHMQEVSSIYTVKH